MGSPGGGVDSSSGGGGGGRDSGGASSSSGGSDNDRGSSSVGGGNDRSDSNNSNDSDRDSGFGQSVADARAAEDGRSDDGETAPSDNDRTSGGSQPSASDLGGYFGDIATSSGPPSIDVGPSETDDGDQSETTPANDNRVDPGLTADQSRSLADGAAVMDGYSFSPADVAPPAEEEEDGFFDRALDAVVDTGKLAGGVCRWRGGNRDGCCGRDGEHGQ